MEKGIGLSWARRLWYKVLAVFLIVGGLILYLLPQVQMIALRYGGEQLRARYEAQVDMNKLLRMEAASLRALERIEAIASEKLHMLYPEAGQVVLVKWEEDGGK